MNWAELSKNKKAAVAVVCVFLVIMAIGGIVGAFLLNYNKFVPTTPSILDDGKSVVITTSQNENYSGYRFRFKSADEEILIDSEDNMLSENELSESKLVVGQIYEVSVCYLGDEKEISSDYSSNRVWVYSVYLQTPQLVLNQEEKIVTWQAVEYADYYYVYYKEANQYQRQRVDQTAFDYSETEGGHKEMYVTAHSSKGGYKSSLPSQTLKFTYAYQLKELVLATFDSSSVSLTVQAEEALEFLSIYIDENAYVVKLSNYTMSNSKYVYHINIVTIYEDGARIGVAPCPADEYSQFNGSILYL